MSKDVTVHHLRLGVSDQRDVWPTRTLVEEALRVVTWPALDAHAVLLVRRLDLGWIDRRAPVHLLARQIEALLRRKRSTAVDAARPEARDAEIVRFRDVLAVREELVRTVLRGAPLDAWYWERLLPGVVTATPAEAILRAVTAELSGDGPLPRRIVEAHVLTSLLERATDPHLLEVAQALSRGRPTPPPPSAGPASAAPAAVPVLARASRAMGRLRRLASAGVEPSVLQVLAEAVTIVALPSLLGDGTLPLRAATLLNTRPAAGAPPSPPPPLSPPKRSVNDAPPASLPAVAPRPLANERPSDGSARSTPIPVRGPPQPPRPEPARPPVRWLPDSGGEVTHGRARFPDLELRGLTRLGGLFFTIPLLGAPDLPWEILTTIGVRAGVRHARRRSRPRRPQPSPPLRFPPPDPLLRWVAGNRVGGDTPLPTLALPAELTLPALVCRPALFAATPTHVDLIFPLSSVDLRVRLRALDTDPGWVPWLGRVVAYHYVEDEEWHAALTEVGGVDLPS